MIRSTFGDVLLLRPHSAITPERQVDQILGRSTKLSRRQFGTASQSLKRLIRSSKNCRRPIWSLRQVAVWTHISRLLLLIINVAESPARVISQRSVFVHWWNNTSRAERWA